MTFKELIIEVKSKLSSINTKEDLATLEIEFLGKDSVIMTALKNLSVLSESEKKMIGQGANEAKKQIIELLAIKKKEIDDLIVSKLNQVPLDITYFEKHGNASLNPVTVARWKLEDIFSELGFDIKYPYEVDSYDNNFHYVNMPKGHPATDAWDTFYTKEGFIPIVHTSSIQNRILTEISNKLEVNDTHNFYGAVVPGRCFRRESTDARHEHTFHQLEGIAVGKRLKFTDMVGVLKVAFETYFETEIEMRIIPDYFPFVEPGNGIEIRWNNPSENILKITKGTGWLEVLGCGMIHPNVLEMANINPEVYSGFAWGCGIERLLMIKEGIEDLRLFFNGGTKFQSQFNNY